MPPQQTPAGSPAAPVDPVPQGTNWAAVLGGIVALLLIAGGVYYFFFIQGGEMAAPQEQNTAPSQNDSVDSIEADLNASGNADTSADLDSLEQSL